MTSLPKVATPLAKALIYLGVTQQRLGEALGLQQAAISKALRGCSPAVAERIVGALGESGERLGLDELHLIYPERYPDWTPGAVHSSSEPGSLVEGT